MGGWEDIWYATNIEIVDYLKAGENLIYSAEGNFVYNPSVQTVWLNVDGKAIPAKAGIQTQLF